MKHLGAIAAGHPETARAAATVLAEGGNAFDGVLAAVCAACVTEPVLASLGGGGFLLARPAGHAPVLYDFFPQTPKRQASAAVDFHPVFADFGTTRQEFHIGMGSMATPGMVRGLFRIHRDLGSLPFARLIEPAVRLARRGAAIAPLQARVLEIVSSIYLSNEECRRVYGSRRQRGKTLAAGEVLTLPEFADTLETLAERGEDWFYEGEPAARLVDDCRARGGLLEETDLRNYQVEVRRPLDIAFGDARLFINPPPSMGGLLIAFGLELLKDGGFGSAAFGSAGHLGRLARVMALTNRARAEEINQGNLDAAATLLHPDLLAAYRAEVAGHPAATRGTTHISVIDGAGNAASLTVTNGEGAAYIIPGTGVMMNNMLGEEDINPDGFHCWPADRRLSSMMAPCLSVFPDGAIEALGSGGSNRIRTAILQVLANRLLFGMDPEAAVASPRIHVEGGRVSVEAGFEAGALAALDGAFAEVERWDTTDFFFGGVHCVRFDPADGGRFMGVGDPRRGGVFRLVQGGKAPSRRPR